MADTVNTTQALSFSDLCRLCAVETVENGVNIFDEINSSEPLVAIINRYFPIKIVGDGKLPKKICQSCNQSVKDIISYFNLLVSGQQRLRELWKEQLERLRREKKQLESNGSDFTILITAPAANPDGQQLFDENHVISLAIEGRESPRRRPGRPRKQKPTEISVELMLEDTTAQQPAEDVDPEQALELMFKEAEENRITSFDSSRHRRQRRVPQRFQGVVQGKELDAILRDEGLEEELIEENEELDKDDETAVEVILEEDENERPTRSKLSKKLHKKRQFVCHHCCRTFVHFGHFTQHVRNCPHQSKFACLTCKEMYDTKEELSVHQEQSRHNEEEMVRVQSAEPEEEIGQQEEYKCVCCEAIYNQQSALTKHITEVHAAENSNICDLCGKIFSHPSSVIYHKEVAHSKRAFNCQICQKEFKHRQLLQRHLLVHSDDRPFVCHVCGATFKTRANLYNHSNIHSEEKRYSCTHCDAQFSHKTSLTLHTRWHTGEKPFACNFCDKKFSQGGNLQEHLRIHTGEKPYSCNVCSKRFTTSSQRRLHMKRHTGERPYKCEFCGKDFLHKDSYECHLRRHRGDKPFSCEICQRTFAEQWALKKHSRLHTGEKPYSCTICNKAFSDLSNLQKHKKTHKNGEQAELADGTGLNAAANVADNQEDSTNALSTLTDGQHFIYVTNDQSQLLITTIGNQTGLPVFGTDEAIECDPSLISLQTEPHHGVETSETPTLNNNHQEEEAIEHSGGNQTVEFITQDGNRIRLTLPVKR